MNCSIPQFDATLDEEGRTAIFPLYVPRSSGNRPVGVGVVDLNGDGKLNGGPECASIAIVVATSQSR